MDFKYSVVENDDRKGVNGSGVVLMCMDGSLSNEEGYLMKIDIFSLEGRVSTILNVILYNICLLYIQTK